MQLSVQLGTFRGEKEWLLFPKRLPMRHLDLDLFWVRSSRTGNPSALLSVT